MTQKEKARAYDEALEKARIFKEHLIEINQKGFADEMEYIFPELKESEDERIRKEIIDFLWKEKIFLQEAHLSVENSPKYRFVMDAIAWLEKQGEKDKLIKELGVYKVKYMQEVLNQQLEKQDEQKPDDMIESKFKVGEWVTNSIETVQITGYDIDYGYQVNYKGNLQHRDTDIIEKEYHIWTIQDAKDGDVLYLQKDGKEHIIIYKGIIKERFRTFVSAYCAYNGIVDAFCFADVSRYADIAYGGIMPATKEQRDTLFAKMKEAGYEWDAEKKELKKTNYQPRVADYEDFREWEDEKSEAEMVGMEDPVLQRLDKILDVLMEIKINTVLRQPYITSDPPQPIQPWYGTETVTCGEQTSTETTTNALDNERPEATM